MISTAGHLIRSKSTKPLGTRPTAGLARDATRSIPDSFGNRLGFNDFDRHAVGATDQKAFHFILGTVGDRLDDFCPRRLHSVEHGLNRGIGKRDPIDRPACGRLDVRQWLVAHQGGAGFTSGLPKKIIVTLSHEITLIQMPAKVDISPWGLLTRGSLAFNPRCFAYRRPTR